MFEQESKLGNSVTVLLVCGPKKGILNKIGWTVVTFGTLIAWTGEYWIKKVQKLHGA